MPVDEEDNLAAPRVPGEGPEDYQDVSGRKAARKYVLKVHLMWGDRFQAVASQGETYLLIRQPV